VAALGRDAHRGPADSQGLLKNVKRQRELCNEVADEVERYLRNVSSAGGAG
jgi:hypothetical protein